jgi:hypothetical protein
MYYYFTSPVLYEDLFQRKINSCGTVRHDRRQIPQDTRPKTLKLKRGDTVTRVRGNPSVVRWKDRRDVYVLTSTHPLQLRVTSRMNLAVLLNPV